MIHYLGSRQLYVHPTDVPSAVDSASSERGHSERRRPSVLEVLAPRSRELFEDGRLLRRLTLEETFSLTCVAEATPHLRHALRLVNA